MKLGRSGNEEIEEISFGWKYERTIIRPNNDALVVATDIIGVWVARIFIDTGSSVNVMYYDWLKQLHMETQLQPPMGCFFGFAGEVVVPVGILRASSCDIGET